MPGQTPDFRTDIYGYPGGPQTTRPGSGGGGGGVTAPVFGGGGDSGGREGGGWTPLEGYENPAPVTPYPGTVPENRPGDTNQDTRRGGGGGGGLPFGLSSTDLISLILSLAGITGGALGRRNTNLSTATTDPALQAVLGTMQGRLTKSEPLYDSILAMANGLLPTQYQRSGVGGAQAPTLGPGPGESDTMPPSSPGPTDGRPPRVGLPPPARGPVRSPVLY